MSVAARTLRHECTGLSQLRDLADRISLVHRLALISESQVHLHKEGRKNNPAWLAAIRLAKNDVYSFTFSFGTTSLAFLLVQLRSTAE